jgi:hypothetical protein
LLPVIDLSRNAFKVAWRQPSRARRDRLVRREIGMALLCPAGAGGHVRTSRLPASGRLMGQARSIGSAASIR